MSSETEFYKRKVYEALCRYNYFPDQKKSSSEIPTFITSRRFTPEVVEKLCTTEVPKSRKLGYDLVEYSITRHNNISRKLGIPHPHAYAKLAKEIHDNWDKIEHIEINPSSIIKPEVRPDGRLVVMNYESQEEKIFRATDLSFAKNFIVETDISSCFSSIYTHAIPWALVGIKTAKNNNDNKEWFNKIDFHQRRLKRAETIGVPIGPVTSTIVVELILGKVDNILRDKGYSFIRYIDDYVCYCSSSSDVDNFINTLEGELRKVKLSLNINKTKVTSLPSSHTDNWTTALLSQLPKNLFDDDGNKRNLTQSELIRFLNSATDLKNETPDGSVLKYALSVIENHINIDDIHVFLKYVLNLCWHYPILLPHLEIFFNKIDSVKRYEREINEIIINSSKKHQSDGMAWAIYYINKYNLNISSEAFGRAYKTKDCLTLLCLYSNGSSNQHIIDFAYSLFCEDNYKKDEYWILLYELYYKGEIENPYDDKCFEVLKSFDVTFIPEMDSISPAELKCDEIQTEILFSGIEKIFS